MVTAGCEGGHSILGDLLAVIPLTPPASGGILRGVPGPPGAAERIEPRQVREEAAVR